MCQLINSYRQPDSSNAVIELNCFRICSRFGTVQFEFVRLQSSFEILLIQARQLS